MTSDLTRFCHMSSEKLRWCLFSFYSFLNQSCDRRWSSNHSLITAGLCNRNVIMDARPAKCRNVTVIYLQLTCYYFDALCTNSTLKCCEDCSGGRTFCSINLATNVNKHEVSNTKADIMHVAHSSSLADSSDSQATLHLLWNRKFPSRVQNSLPLNHIPSQMSPVPALTSYLFQVHFNIILPSAPRFTKRLLPFKFSNQILYELLISHALCILHTSHHILIGHSHNEWRTIQITDNNE
jgi:hypothetical protein